MDRATEWQIFNNASNAEATRNESCTVILYLHRCCQIVGSMIQALSHLQIEHGTDLGWQMQMA